MFRFEDILLKVEVELMVDWMKNVRGGRGCKGGCGIRGTNS